jgi:hypothetical protein
MRRMPAALAAIGCAKLVFALALLVGATSPAAAGRAPLNLVLVLDGLRPDAITPDETPNLWRLRQEGLYFPNSHAVFPTVTRVNAPAISTGTYPDRNGILGNRIYVRAVDPNLAFNNDDHRNLLRLDEVTDGRMVLTKSLAEILAERGKRLAVASSGSTGQALLLNPRAPKGVGVLLNGYWEPGVRVAFPSMVNDAVLARFGPAPARGGASASDDAAVAWTQGVLRDYVLPELKPDVVFNWLTEPDHIQHGLGAGSPQARASIRADDAEVGLLLKTLDTLGLARSTNVIVVSDHGFSHSGFGVNLTAELIKAGLKASAASDDVVIASSGQTMLLHVKDRDPALIHRITDFLKAQDWAGVLFTRGRGGEGRAPVEGIEPGTFALELTPRTPGTRTGYCRDLSLELGARPTRRTRHRFHGNRARDRTAHRQPGQSRQHEPVDRAQHLHRLGRRLQTRKDDPHAREQCRHNADTTRLARIRRRRLAAPLRRAGNPRGLRRRARRGAGAGADDDPRHRHARRRLPRRYPDQRGGRAALH